MATIEQRTGKDGQQVYRVKVRRKAAPPLSATSLKLSEAKKWAHVDEGAVLEGRHFKTMEAKRHTLAEMIDRYLREVLPQKSASSIEMQTLQHFRIPMRHLIKVRNHAHALEWHRACVRVEHTCITAYPLPERRGCASHIESVSVVPPSLIVFLNVTAMRSGNTPPTLSHW